MAKRFTDTINVYTPKSDVKENLQADVKETSHREVSNTGYSYGGASYSKNAFKGFTAESINPKLDIDFNNQELRSRSRILCMTSPIATSAIRTLRTNVVGVGIIPKPRLDTEVLGIDPEVAFEIQKQIEKEWNLWANDKHNCDATGVNNFYAMQQLAYTSYRQSGDCFILFKW